GPHVNPQGKQTFHYVAAANVILASYEGNEEKWHIDKEWFRNKIVLVGGLATGTHDEKPTPVSTRSPGVEIQATAIMNLLRGDEVHRLGFATTTFATLIASCLAAIGVIFPHNAWRKLLGGFAAVALLIAIGAALF